jgi:UDP-N-acetylglucosamine 1-carboxyvinyltransferase
MHLIVNGGRPLRGALKPSANKNAVLPILCASLLCDEPITLHRVPDITDVRKLLAFFRAAGSDVESDLDNGLVRIHHRTLSDAALILPVGMRSSVMLVPPLLARLGRARLENDTKGCTLGVREIDPHLDIFKAFGSSVDAFDDHLTITAGDKRAHDHWPDYASVTGTENFVMSALSGQGVSRLTNAACEPHVQEFCDFLIALGARIEGVGTSRLTVQSADTLKGAEFTFQDDFHEVATFMALGAITGGDVQVRNDASHQFGLLDRNFAKFGIEVSHQDGWSSAKAPNGLRVARPYTGYMLPKVEAAPWPYLPADLLPIFVALGVRAEGQMMFWNKVYEGGLSWCSEIAKFGGHAMLCDPHRLVTFGDTELSPATVESPYIIRVAIALLMIAVSVEGRSTILNADPIRRAHPNFVENLKKIGAEVDWVDTVSP